VLDTPTPGRWAVWLTLVVNQSVKLLYEESLLRARFPAYPAYMRRTKRLLPYLI
jgi:protein-S-isoprenylcysteine O-methyltransferase Ste14